MEIRTPAFGPVEIDEAQIVTFTQPMLGFPDDLRFVVLDPDPEVPFQWLQSVDHPEVCFLITDPRPFFPDYRIEAKEAELRDLRITDPDQAAVAVVVNLSEGIEGATANLLAPIVFNTERKLARQVVLEGSGYPLRARLFPPEERVREAAG
ncbi:MAG: flagellar assembly protein FliW [Deltaproteobacteria bacterium]|nr:flagellar assembly protein FliW [Deltaproteobacteria bacterium]